MLVCALIHQKNLEILTNIPAVLPILRKRSETFTLKPHVRVRVAIEAKLGMV